MNTVFFHEAKKRLKLRAKRPLQQRLPQHPVSHTIQELLQLARNNYHGELKEQVHRLQDQLEHLKISENLRQDMAKTLHNVMETLLYEKSHDNMDYAEHKLRTLLNRIHQIHMPLHH